MLKYVQSPAPDKSVKVFGRGLRISRKNSVAVCKAITGKPLPKATAFVEKLIKGIHDLDGKYYTKASHEILQLLKSAAVNAEFKGLEAARLIVNASAHQGFSFFRPRRFKMRRQKRHVTHIQLVLHER